MKYHIKTTTEKSEDYWSSIVGKSGKVKRVSIIDDSTDDVEIFKGMVFCSVCPSSYELTKENIEKAFPDSSENDVEQIKDNLGYRNRAYSDMIAWIDDQNGKPGYFNIDIPVGRTPTEYKTDDKYNVRLEIK